VFLGLTYTNHQPAFRQVTSQVPNMSQTEQKQTPELKMNPSESTSKESSGDDYDGSSSSAAGSLEMEQNPSPSDQLKGPEKENDKPPVSVCGPHQLPVIV